MKVQCEDGSGKLVFYLQYISMFFVVTNACGQWTLLILSVSIVSPFAHAMRAMRIVTLSMLLTFFSTVMVSLRSELKNFNVKDLSDELSLIRKLKWTILSVLVLIIVSDIFLFVFYLNYNYDDCTDRLFWDKVFIFPVRIIYQTAPGFFIMLTHIRNYRTNGQ